MVQGRWMFSILTASIWLSILMVPVTAANEMSNASRMEKILQRLKVAEEEMGTLRGELDDALEEVSSLGDQVDSLKQVQEEDSASSLERNLANERLREKIVRELLAGVTGGSLQRESFAPEVIEAGRKAFEVSCTQCHDAARALESVKDLTQWRSVARAMARKRGASILEKELEPIAVYLVSLTTPKLSIETEGTWPGTPSVFLPTDQPSVLGGKLDLDLTLSTVWRGSPGGFHELENSGFFPETWFGGEWHSSTSPMRLKVHACVTCHTEGAEGNRVELTEAVTILDLHRMSGMEDKPWQVSVQAGRFVVPFGSFAQRSHPGAFRTVTKPLLFNMGQNVSGGDIGAPVLPMPYSDEGVMTNVTVPLHEDFSLTVDPFLVNGLKGNTTGIDFYESRDYADNNSGPAYGSRVTVGTPSVRLGSSYMAGQFNGSGSSGVLDRDLDYDLFGIDLTFRHQDVVRLQTEFATRDSERFLFLPDKQIGDEEVKGFSFEAEIRVLQAPRVSMVGRYDMIEHNGDLPPSGSSLTHADFNVDRLTWGFNTTLPGGSLLLINHEHWFLPDELDNVDVIGVRWVGMF